MQFTLPGFDPVVANKLALSVLKQFAPEMLMPVSEQQDLLRHCQRGNKPAAWYWWHHRQHVAPLQMPELFEILEQKAMLDEKLQALKVEEDDAKTD